MGKLEVIEAKDSNKKLKKLKRKAEIPAKCEESATFEDAGNLSEHANESIKFKKVKKHSKDETIVNNGDEISSTKIPTKDKKKTKKKSSEYGEESSPSDMETNEETALPTTEQLKEAEEIQSSTASLTKRQKKKKRHEKLVEEKKSHNVDKEKQRNEEYLTKWKNSKGDWKFEKLRQISIQNSIFEENNISEEIWPIALEYLSGSKGAAKKAICELAKGVLNKLDEQCSDKSEEEKQTIINSIKYQRARDLLQNSEEL